MVLESFGQFCGHSCLQSSVSWGKKISNYYLEQFCKQWACPIKFCFNAQKKFISLNAFVISFPYKHCMYTHISVDT